MYKVAYRTCTVSLIFSLKNILSDGRSGMTTLPFNLFKKTKKSFRIPFQKHALIKYWTCENSSLHFKRLKILCKVDSIQIALERLLLNIQCNILEARQLQKIIIH